MQHHLKKGGGNRNYLFLDKLLFFFFFFFLDKGRMGIFVVSLTAIPRGWRCICAVQLFSWCGVAGEMASIESKNSVIA